VLLLAHPIKASVIPTVRAYRMDALPVLGGKHILFSILRNNRVGLNCRTTPRARKNIKQQAIGRAQKIGGAERALSVMEITRQPDANRNQCDCHDEGQHVSQHSVPVMVFFVVALVFSEAQ
jgi:hypothetical protein